MAYNQIKGKEKTLDLVIQEFTINIMTDKEWWTFILQ
jgi:hypothetical protein